MDLGPRAGCTGWPDSVYLRTPLSRFRVILARVLLAGGELTKNGAKYLEEGLRWCDAFAERQQRAVTSLGKRRRLLVHGSAGGC